MVTFFSSVVGFLVLLFAPICAGLALILLPLYASPGDLNGSFSCRFEDFIFESFSLDILVMLVLFLIFEFELYYVILAFNIFVFGVILVMLLELVLSVV